MQTDNCVSEPDLARFVLGDLDAQQLRRVAAHVDDCTPCQETVVAIAEQSNTFVEAIQAAGTRAPMPQENALKLGLKRILASLRGAPASGDTAVSLLAGERSQIGPYRMGCNKEGKKI